MSIANCRITRGEAALPTKGESKSPGSPPAGRNTEPCAGARSSVSVTGEPSVSVPNSGTNTGVNGAVHVCDGLVSKGASSTAATSMVNVAVSEAVPRASRTKKLKFDMRTPDASFGGTYTTAALRS
eukprot:4765781-Prymnesium_polylepis.2